MMTKDLFEKMAFIRWLILIKTLKNRFSQIKNVKRFSIKRRESYGQKEFKRVGMKKKRFKGLKDFQ